MIWLIALFILCAAAFAVLALIAPLGWEDEQGFHFAEPGGETASASGHGSWLRHGGHHGR